MDQVSSGRDTRLTGATSEMSQASDTEDVDLDEQKDLLRRKRPSINTNQFFPTIDMKFPSKKHEIEEEVEGDKQLVPVPETKDEATSDSKSVHFTDSRGAGSAPDEEERPQTSGSISLPATPKEGQTVSVIGMLHLLLSNWTLNQICH